ncbi:hypothetical protein [Tropicibacter oceani]|uniref:Uncharacterized protein n=1 Tax=Tropicibacter oceani TaxID=3058420 RepID=A0ABY8QK00_9RHOB|nr:hypothetical protein [Tropicibacter oceani]WGW04950.1 hypothetical protein QF118_05220 [Tropicibacter oceani]
MTRQALSFVYAQALLVAAGLGTGYDALSPGFAARSADGPFYCCDLMSSGGYDDAFMMLFFFLALPALLRLARFSRAITRLETVLFIATIGAALAALGLASMDCANPLYTAFGIPDLVLATALVAAAFSVPLHLTLRR